MRNVTAETEEHPAMEVHLGEIYSYLDVEQRYRRCIIWINGKRWEGNLEEVRDAFESDTSG